MEDLKRLISGVMRRMLECCIALTLYHSFLQGLGYRQDPLLRSAAQHLHLDQCAAVRRGEIPEHPMQPLTPYATIWVWLNENPYWLCRLLPQTEQHPPQ
jgi:hypothetical protein